MSRHEDGVRLAKHVEAAGQLANECRFAKRRRGLGQTRRLAGIGVNDDGVEVVRVPGEQPVGRAGVEHLAKRLAGWGAVVV